MPSSDDLDLQTLPSSAKTRKLIELLEKIESDSEGEDKTIVFSQFTSFLDIVEKFLRKAGKKFVRCKCTTVLTRSLLFTVPSGRRRNDEIGRALRRSREVQE